MYQDILYDVDDPVATITLNRPDQLNAWTPRMGHEVEDAMRKAEADPSVVGIIVTGAGRGFCAGADMKGLSSLASGEGSAGGGADRGDESDAGGEALIGDGSDFGGRLMYPMAISKPVLAAVNGAVAGMAYPFVLAADIRVASRQALFVTAFAHRGLIAEWGLSWLLPRLVGPSAALDLLFSSRRVDGEEALRLGLVNYMVDADDLVPFCRRYIQDLAAKGSPASYAVMKRQVYEQMHRGLGAAEQESQQLMQESFDRPDFAEGVKSFTERRPPQFPRVGG